MEAKDILLEDNDLKFSTLGDFEIGESDNQHQQDIIFENIGAYKEHPLVGVGIINYLNSTNTQLQLAREIKLQLEVDGYVVESVDFVGTDISNFTIDAIRS